MQKKAPDSLIDEKRGNAVEAATRRVQSNVGSKGLEAVTSVDLACHPSVVDAWGTRWGAWGRLRA